MSRIALTDIEAKYERGEPLTMLTAYDGPTAKLVAESGVDVILVANAAGRVDPEDGDALPPTLDEALSKTNAVARSADRPLVVADLPFGPDVARSVETADRFLNEAGADAVKVQTPPDATLAIDVVEQCTAAGIPVQGHVGLTPREAAERDGPRVRAWDGPDSEAADELVETASAVADAGAFSLVVERTAESVAERITEAVDVPTIGIGAGRYTDGQVLVTDDVVGLDSEERRFSKRYATVSAVIEQALTEFVDDVRDGAFPTRDHVREPIESE